MNIEMIVCFSSASGFQPSLYYYTIWELVKHHSTAASLTWQVQGLWVCSGIETMICKLRSGYWMRVVLQFICQEIYFMCQKLQLFSCIVIFHITLHTCGTICIHSDLVHPLALCPLFWVQICPIQASAILWSWTLQCYRQYWISMAVYL